MSKVILLVTFLTLSVQSYSENNSLRKDTLLFFEMDIRSKSNNPVTMNGVIKNFDYSIISKENGEKFIESFYKQAHFVPSFLLYDDVINECIRLKKDDSLAKYRNSGQRMMSIILGNGGGKRIILNDGENVFIRITKLTGRFLLCNKNEISLPTISNGPGLQEISEIDTIYIPVEIIRCDKPSRRCLNKMFK